MSALYPWQQSLWHQLQGYIQQQRIPQGLLLTGYAGQGKRQLAEHYAAALICEKPDANSFACGHCSACHLFQAQTHPDFFVIQPDEPGKAIGIDKIRQLTVKLALKPQFEQYRVVIFDPADALNNASANGFLKCLEEPTERTCFILIAQQANKLPATIRSRCQKIHCAVPDNQQALTWLAAQGVKQNAETLLQMAQGSPLLALQYQQQGAIELRQRYFQHWLQIAEGKTHWLEIAEQWQKTEPLETAVLLTWLSSWLVDLIKLAQAATVNELLNPDLANDLKRLLAKLDLKALYAYYDKVLISRAQLSTQLNKQLLIESLLIDWSQLSQS